MPRRDRYHDVVRNALIKEGWTIVHDPMKLGQKVRLYVDLGADRLIIAERRTERIAVEIKVFGSISPITELQKSVGQYLLYRSLLKKQEPERQIFLALSQDAYSPLFSQSEIADYIAELDVNILVFDPEAEEISQWLKS
ncbi:MAG: fatty-acid synthase [Spirulina sp. SIO3F2]|nr:fatty-acid synthase [Spirulina sp. SIO3F2]